MGATLSLCWFMPGWMCFAHVGDSRIYYLPAGGGMIQVSQRPHATSAGCAAHGRINEREARNHPLRSALSQALGGGQQAIDPQIGRIGCEPGDRFLICSDGLVDGLWDRRIAEMARAAGRTGEFRVDAAGRRRRRRLRPRQHHRPVDRCLLDRPRGQAVLFARPSPARARIRRFPPRGKPTRAATSRTPLAPCRPAPKRPAATRPSLTRPACRPAPCRRRRPPGSPHPDPARSRLSETANACLR